MNEKEELKHELEKELQWVKYRKKMLDIINEKLVEMKQLADYTKHDNYTSQELELLNIKINNLAEQVRALDEESRITEDEKILE